MKIRILALVLGCLLLCSGCTAMLERNHSSTTSHVDYSITEDSSILRAESYQALLNSLLYFVNEHVGSGTIRLYNYTGNVTADLQRACGNGRCDRFRRKQPRDRLYSAGQQQPLERDLHLMVESERSE